jgi:hypothetical protein
MTDLEERILDVLRDRAEAEVDTRTLTEGALRSGHRHRRRRRVTRIAACGLALAAVGAVALYQPGGDVPEQAADQPKLVYREPAYDTATGTYPTLPLPPHDPAAPTAAQDPTVVGTVGLIHFSFGPEAGIPPMSQVVYQPAARDGVEMVSAVTSPLYFSFMLSRTEINPSATPGTGMKSRKAAIGTYHYLEHFPESGRLVWQPVPGLWALLMINGDETALVKAAGAVKLDRTFRVVVPFTVGGLPAGSTRWADTMTFEAGAVTSTVNVGTGADDNIMVRSGPAKAGAAVPAGEATTINGRPAVITSTPYCEQGGDPTECARVTVPLVSVRIDLGHTVVTVSNKGNVDRAAVLAVANRVVDRYTDDLATWPASPLP